MTATSDVATAPVSPGAAARPARSQRRLAYGWRVLRTGVAFLTFGIGAIVAAAVVWPLRLLPRRTAARREAQAQRGVHGAFRLFAPWMAPLRLRPVSRISPRPPP